MAVCDALFIAAALVTQRMPSVDAAFARHGPALVAVHAQADGTDFTTTGFFVTSSGLVATVLPAVGGATVTLADGGTRPARAVARQDGPPAEGLLTLLQVEAGADEVFAALRVRSAPLPASLPVWWLALSMVEGRPSPSLGGARAREGHGRLRLDVPAAPGAPVLLDDEVAAVVVWRVDRTASMAVDVSALVALAERVRPVARAASSSLTTSSTPTPAIAPAPR